MDWTSFLIGVGVSAFWMVFALFAWAGRNVNLEQKRTIDAASRTVEAHDRLMEYWRAANLHHGAQAEALGLIARVLDERLWPIDDRPVFLGGKHGSANGCDGVDALIGK